ncbi:unnamed protein product [Adineta ricciae]|uniref:Nucleoporin NUP42 n=1 Tax=Adineta ricciae TaxID=249248 RepID=A0A814YDQ7_ADIRI|nr:unnamed protein product [Adineta ricciae]
MSLCQHFLRGNCRFGNNCRYSHVTPTEAQATRFAFRSRPERPQIDPIYNYVAPAATNIKHFNAESTTTRIMKDASNSPIFKWVKENFRDEHKAIDILIQMQKEAKVWLKSSLWRFTSRSLFPGGRALEPWIDYSFEEVRWLHRSMIEQSQEHVFKKQYSDYLVNTERQLAGLSKSNPETFAPLKPYIDEYIQSAHKPSTVLASDVDMKDADSISTTRSDTNAAIYTADHDLLAEEREAFENALFELGQIPVHAPPQRFC